METFVPPTVTLEKFAVIDVALSVVFEKLYLSSRAKSIDERYPNIIFSFLLSPTSRTNYPIFGNPSPYISQ